MAAGLTSSGPLLKPPLLSRIKLKPSLQDSTLFGLCFSSPNSCNFKSYLSLSSSSSSSSSSSVVVSARSGGRGGNYYDDEDDEDGEDDESALDVSTVKSATVRLIDEQQKMIGIVSKSEAVSRAKEAGLDLVVVSPEADPPVVKIMSFEKYRYELQKKKRDQQKRSAAGRMDMKEVKMGYNIDVHDYSVRLQAAQSFLKDGDKLKVIVRLKGRQNTFLGQAVELMKKFRNDLGELAIEEYNNFAGRKKEHISGTLYMLLLPNKNVLQKGQDEPKKGSSAANEVSASIDSQQTVETALGERVG